MLILAASRTLSRTREAVLRHGGDGDEDGSREGRERSTKTNYVLF